MVKASQLDNEYIRKLYNEGNSIREIAKQLNADHSTVRYRIKKMQILVRKSHKRCKLNVDNLKQLYREGFSLLEIALKSGVNVWTIKQRLKATEVKIRSAKERAVRGDKHYHWRGGKTEKMGYVLLYMPNHPRALSGYVREHIWVWEKTYGKPVPRNHLIHHLNGIKNDNRPENLVAIKRGTHASLAEPFKRRIRELEMEINILRQPKLNFGEEGIMVAA